MAKDKSIFQEIADSQRLQIFIDQASDKISPPWYRSYFTIGAPQMSLTYNALLGGSDNVAAASIVARDSETPLRSREAIDIMTGEIPAIRVMRSLSESQYRDYMTLQNLNLSDSVKKQQIMQLIYGDIAYVIKAIDRRIDFLVAQGLSTGQIDITVDNNPDGTVTPAAVVLPGRQLATVDTEWSTTASSDPIKDIANVVNAGKAKGIEYGKILMDNTLIQNVLKSSAFIDVVDNPPLVTLGLLNEVLSASGLPVIEEVNFRMSIEENGVNKAYNPWKVENAVFVPNGNLGEIKNALAVEDMRPVEKVAYSKSNGKLISKWSQNEPFREWTKGEFNAIPTFNEIKNTTILQTDQTS